ncbi:MAG: exodeoxyribonuclease VII large subunit [Hyphomicrobiaceae bacterium]
MAEPRRQPSQTPNVAEFTVAELAFAIKRTLESGYGYVRLRGEISGFRGPHSSGHCYFSLKDDKAKIEAVIWRGVYQALRFKPQEGLEVVASGKITTYPGSSKYQIVIESLEPAGVGALMALLEERKRKLAAEGLFDEERKKPLPFLPRVVGIVTSPTGAVIRDMMHGFDERFPVHVIVWPVRVQGETSAREVAAAVAGFNALPEGGRIPRPDVLIVARGGGSLEDLWGFNEESVVRAVAASRIPVISAVGHETDWTLIDLVADARAPTPTKAAEWAVPKHSDLIERIGEREHRLRTSMARLLDGARDRFRAAARGLPRPTALVELPRQRLDDIGARLPRALHANKSGHAHRFAAISGKLSPLRLREQIRHRGARLEALGLKAATALQRIGNDRHRAFERVVRKLSLRPLQMRLGRAGERVADLGDRSQRAMRQVLASHQRALETQAKLLAALGYQAVLERGFALVRDSDGRMLRHAGGIAPGQLLEIEFRDGSVAAQTLSGASPPDTSPPDSAGSVSGGAEESSPAKTAAPPATRGRDRNPGDQGTLF